MTHHKRKILKFLIHFFLRLFRHINLGDITIRHHCTKDRLRLHSFCHRNYWFNIKHREAESTRLFKKLIKKDSIVFDVGGHIGYFSLYFAYLVGPKGHVYAFEPGSNNLPYIRHNTKNKNNITLIEKGIGCTKGIFPFYIESFTGQNNSFLKEYTLKRNAERAFLGKRKVKEEQVKVTTLDHFVHDKSIEPDFIKIDVEGSELEVLQGANLILDNFAPILMVEIKRNKKKIFDILQEKGYFLFTPKLKKIKDPEQIWGNIFCIPEKVRRKILANRLQ